MRDNFKKQVEKELKKKTIIGDRTSIQIRKETLKRLLNLKNKKYHPRATYDEMMNKWINGELNLKPKRKKK